MRKSRFSEEKIIGMIKEQESGLPTVDVSQARVEPPDVLQVEGEVRQPGGLRCPPASAARGGER